MSLRGPVLVGMDFSPAAAEALRQGAELARHLDAQLIVCHVVPELIPDGSPFTEFRRAHLDVEQSVLAKARAAVEAELESVLGVDGPAADIVLESGSPHAGLLSQAEATDAGVVVTVPGSVALDVVRHAPGAVLVARPSPRGPVVGATDFSDPSRPAVELAASEARRRGSPLHLLHAFDVGQFALGPSPVAAMPYLEGSSAIALDGLDQLSELAKTRLGEALRATGLAGEAVVVSGRAAEAIVRYAESVHAELVVVGTHGRSGLARLTLGSTAAAVVESAPCAVLVVRLAGR